MRHPFDGVYTVVSTPFHSDGTHDYESLERLLRAQVDRDIDAVILFGIVGEFYKLTRAERRAVVETASAVCDGTSADLVVSVTDHATTLALSFTHKFVMR